MPQIVSPTSFHCPTHKANYYKETILNGCQTNDSWNCLVQHPISESQIIMSLDGMPQVIIKLYFPQCPSFIPSMVPPGICFHSAAALFLYKLRSSFESAVMPTIKCPTSTQNVCFGYWGHTNINLKNYSSQGVWVYQSPHSHYRQGLFSPGTNSLLRTVCSCVHSIASFWNISSQLITKEWMNEWMELHSEVQIEAYFMHVSIKYFANELTVEKMNSTYTTGKLKFLDIFLWNKPIILINV